MNITGLVVSSAVRLGILDAYAFLRRRLAKCEIAILLYHRVSPEKDGWSHESLSPESFEIQMEYLSRNYKILSLDGLVDFVKSRKPPQEKAVVITFDDGYEDNYLYAYPILRKYHIPATIFLVTGHIDTGDLFWWDKVGYIIQHATINELNLGVLGDYSLKSEGDRHRATFIITERLKNLWEDRKSVLIKKMLDACHVEIPPDLGKKLILSWKEVKEMANGGVTFGAHSVNHYVLVNVPLEQAKNEVSQSKRDIEERLGKEVSAFSYPNGDYNADIVELVKASGYVCAVSMWPGGLISLKDCVYQLNRIRARENFYKFKATLCGLWGDLQGHIGRAHIHLRLH